MALLGEATRLTVEFVVHLGIGQFGQYLNGTKVMNRNKAARATITPRVAFFAMVRIGNKCPVTSNVLLSGARLYARPLELKLGFIGPYSFDEFQLKDKDGANTSSQ